MRSLQIQLDANHGGCNGAVAYICGGEGMFPIQRLSQMVKNVALNVGLDETVLMSNIHIEQSHNMDELFETLVSLTAVSDLTCGLILLAAVPQNTRHVRQRQH